MPSHPPSTETEDREALRSLLRWPNVRRMLRTVCDLDEACAAVTHGSEDDAHVALLANAPPEAMRILRYLGGCVGTTHRQRASSFQTWMQENQSWERGRRFLGVPDICLPQPIPPHIDYNQELAAASPALYDMYVQDLLRLLSYGSLLTTDPDPYLDLYRWTDPASATAWFPQPVQHSHPPPQRTGALPGQPQSGGVHVRSEIPTAYKHGDEDIGQVCREVAGLGLVPEHLFLRAPAEESKQLRPLPHGDLRVPIDWKTKLPPVLQWAHAALPWYTPARGSGVVLAGGAALAMAVTGAAASDIDLFLVVPSLDSATAGRRSAGQRCDVAWLLVQEVLEAVQRQVAVHNPSYWVYAMAGSSQHTLDLVIMDKEMSRAFSGENMVAHLQVVLRLYESPAQVVHGFDVDVCTVMFDGVDVWATGRALRALHCGFLLVEPVRQSPSYEVRLHKYSKRLGLDILVPGLDPLLLEPTLQELEAMKSELADQLEKRKTLAWVTTEARRQGVSRNFHRYTRVPTARRLAAKSSGLARLLLVRFLPELGVTVQEARLVTSGYQHWDATAADAVIARGQAYEASVTFNNDSPVICLQLGRSPLLMEEAAWAKLKKRTQFQGSHVHLQTGREALFSGSFTHTPFDDWYRCCLSKLEERLLRGEVDWEARARERVVHEHDALALASTNEMERALEANCQLCLELLAALRARRPRAFDGGRAGGGSNGGGVGGFRDAVAAAARAMEAGDAAGAPSLAIEQVIVLAQQRQQHQRQQQQRQDMVHFMQQQIMLQQQQQAMLLQQQRQQQQAMLRQQQRQQQQAMLLQQQRQQQQQQGHRNQPGLLPEPLMERLAATAEPVGGALQPSELLGQQELQRQEGETQEQQQQDVTVAVAGEVQPLQDAAARHGDVLQPPAPPTAATPPETAALQDGHPPVSPLDYVTERAEQPDEPRGRAGLAQAGTWHTGVQDAGLLPTQESQVAPTAVRSVAAAGVAQANGPTVLPNGAVALPWLSPPPLVELIQGTQARLPKQMESPPPLLTPEQQPRPLPLAAWTNERPPGAGNSACIGQWGPGSLQLRGALAPTSQLGDTLAAVGVQAGAPGLVLGPLCSARTGDLLYLGQRYRLVTAGDVESVAAATPPSGRRQHPMDSGCGAARTSTASAAADEAMAAAPGMHTADGFRSVQARAVVVEGTQPAAPQGSARPSRVAVVELPAMHVGTGGAASDVAACRVDSWVTTVVVLVAGALAAGPSAGSLTVAAARFICSTLLAALAALVGLCFGGSYGGVGRAERQYEEISSMLFAMAVAVVMCLSRLWCRSG